MSFGPLICFLGVFTMGLGSSFPGILTPHWSNTLGITTTKIGTIYAYQTIFALTVGFIIGRLADKQSKKPLIQISLLLYFIGFLNMSIGKNIYLIAIGLLCMGAGGNGIVIVSSTYLITYGGDKSSTLIARLNLFFSAAAVIGPWIIKLTDYSHLYVASILVLLFPTVAFILIGLGYFKEPPLSTDIQETTKAKEISEKEKPTISTIESSSGKPLTLVNFLKSPSLLFLGLAVFAYSGIEGGLVAWMPFYFSKTSNQLAIEPGLWTSWFYFNFMIGRFIYSKKIKKLNIENFLLFSSGVLLSPIIYWLTIGSSNKLLISIALIGLLTASMYPALQLIIAKKAPNAVGLSSIWLMIFGSMANMIWPTITGRGFELYSSRILPIIVLIQCILLFIFLHFSKMKKRLI